MLGQNWEVNDNMDYHEDQDIRNKVKPLLKKQARFMFSNKPDIKLNSTDYLNLSEDIKTIINGFKFLSSNEMKQQPSNQNDLEEEEIIL